MHELLTSDADIHVLTPWNVAKPVRVCEALTNDMKIAHRKTCAYLQQSLHVDQKIATQESGWTLHAADSRKESALARR